MLKYWIFVQVSLLNLPLQTKCDLQQVFRSQESSVNCFDVLLKRYSVRVVVSPIPQ